MTSISAAGGLGGVSEVAHVLGVTRQQVANLRQRPDFPAPVTKISLGELWDLDVIQRWAGSDLRRAAGRPSQDSSAVAVGRRFVLGPEIGRGGVAVVHSARDLMVSTGAQVAVKILAADPWLDADTLTRFQRELALMSRLAHPNVMTVLASGTDTNLGAWYAMPLALGSLADDLHASKMKENDVVAVMRDICAGLDHIHRNGVLHRDLKPQNVLRTPGGTWAIADFGLARDVAESTRLTATADRMGTFLYAAPEQWDDAKHVTAAADIFSAGKILQALLIGSTPVDADIPPGKLAPVVRRAIYHDPGRRHQSATELLTAIETAIAPADRWEPAEERSLRLRQRLAAGIDKDACMEIVKWAETVDDSDVKEFALALSAVPGAMVQAWWEVNPGNFTHVFEMFGRALDRGYEFEQCDPLADFARRAVAIAQDRSILREAIRGLAELGYRHNRWHVRDVVVGILQEIRDGADAASALEGLQLAGPKAAGWTVGSTLLGTVHPILRDGIPLIAPDPAAGKWMVAPW